ncbi:hypothetical protein M5K25_013588 [Dendrobium thyrsiflorum]|uniref:Uncharacterized protein n=1 Tax=Dendrobium thyrsiflorum TaxID=117978 RepID=A0ABD0UTI3_DENTH
MDDLLQNTNFIDRRRGRKQKSSSAKTYMELALQHASEPRTRLPCLSCSFPQPHKSHRCRLLPPLSTSSESFWAHLWRLESPRPPPLSPTRCRHSLSCCKRKLELIRHQKIIMIGHESRSKIKLETSGVKIGIIRTPISVNL